MAAQARLSEKKTAPLPMISNDRTRTHAGATLPFHPMSRGQSKPAGDYMEHRPCPICGGERHRSLFQYDDFQFYTDAAFSKRVPIRQVQCLDCFGVFMNPVFTAKGFAILFAEAGASYGSTSGRQAEQLEWLKARGLLEPATRLLDIGCYEGSFIGKLPAGIKGVGVDIDEPAIERARQRHGETSAHEFICADFECFEISGDVDVITMFHVLEHLPRPGAVLKRLAALASPKTRLLVEVPIFENVIYGDICGFITVQHLTHFSLASLRNLLHESGWRQVSVQSMEGYNGFRVIAEPAVQCRSEPAPDDTGLTLNYLSKWYGAVADVETRLHKLTASHCVLRGGGLQTEYLMQLTSLFGGQCQFLIADQDPLKQGKTWRGIPIVGTDCLASVDSKDTQLILSSYSHQDAMRDEAAAHGLSADTVIPLYDHISRY